MVDIADIVTYTNFGDHRLRGFWVAGGQISPSPVRACDVIVFDPLFTGHVIRRMRSGRVRFFNGNQWEPL